MNILQVINNSIKEILMMGFTPYILKLNSDDYTHLSYLTKMENINKINIQGIDLQVENITNIKESEVKCKNQTIYLHSLIRERDKYKNTRAKI